MDLAPCDQSAWMSTAEAVKIYFLPREICFEAPKVWPLTPLAICWISPPDFRKAAICALIESLVSTAGAGLAFELDAFTRMAAINLYKINTAGHLIGMRKKLLGNYPRRTIDRLIPATQSISLGYRLNACFNCDVSHARMHKWRRDDLWYPSFDLTSGRVCVTLWSQALVKTLIFKACVPLGNLAFVTGNRRPNSGRMPPT